ncbi:MAG: phenylalanine--tRNA ligase subunit beta [Planctomycetota bacterium]|jgi:phenylalanyl-tRNA synthetase beta chain
MQLSLNWLADHVDLSGLEPETIARELTLKTALIEGVHDQRAALAGVVVGEVLGCLPHPGADRLTLCSVEHGGERPASVVCGAPNVAVGQRVLYAPVGTTLPTGLKLKAAKIRGESSEGMICAEDELGLGPEHDGIMVLSGAPEVGTPAGALPGLADVILEIDNKSITHRPDLWGHRGFAREVAAIFGRTLKPLALDETLAVADEGPHITLDAGEGCPLYAGLCLEDEPSRSPDWLRLRLIACGVRPLTLLVDLSNYVMLELGQPTHPFDRDRLAGDRIVVRGAAEGEILRTLDGESRALEPADTVIADAERTVALAGIMGGEDSEIGDATRRVFLESACFDPIGVRRTSSRLGLRTDALSRFEKGLDPDLVEVALRRYARLLQDLRPQARIAQRYRVAGAALAPATVLHLDPDLVSRRLGTRVEEHEIRTALASIGCVVREAAGGLEVTVPAWRAIRDLTIPEDLVEEVGRLLGYDRLPDTAPVGPLRLGRRDPVLALEDRLRDGFAAQGFTETLSYSMVPDATLERAGLEQSSGLLRLANPLQQDAARLRPSLAPGQLSQLEQWLRHTSQVRVVEVGRGYGRTSGGEVVEAREVMAVLAWREAGDSRDLVRELRGAAEAALLHAGLPAVDVLPWTPPAEMPWFHPRRSAVLQAGPEAAVVGQIGAVAPGVLGAFDVRGAAGLIRIDVASLATLDTSGVRFETISRYPPVRIDLAFVLGYDLATETVARALQAAGPKTLRRVEAFDVYRGAPLAPEERSVAFHLVFQANDRTLTDADVERARARLLKAAEKLGARLR